MMTHSGDNDFPLYNRALALMAREYPRLTPDEHRQQLELELEERGQAPWVLEQIIEELEEPVRLAPAGILPSDVRNAEDGYTITPEQLEQIKAARQARRSR